jgi:hypothetical protein
VTSSRNATDRLLKELHIHLAGGIRAARLRALGWFDFRSLDHPQNLDAVALGHAAFVYLSFDENGNWNNATDVLVAIKAFLDTQTGYEADKANLLKLAALLKERPVRSQAVQDWFDQVYR